MIKCVICVTVKTKEEVEKNLYFIKIKLILINLEFYKYVYCNPQESNLNYTHTLIKIVF
jgi:hypothetical protein